MSQTPFDWQDPFLLHLQLNAEERMVRDAAANFAKSQLLPRVTLAFRHETTDPAIFREMGERGLLGVTVPEKYGGAGLSYVGYGLIAREIERIDSGYRSMLSVQSSLVMLLFLNSVPKHKSRNTCQHLPAARPSVVLA